MALALSRLGLSRRCLSSSFFNKCKKKPCGNEKSKEKPKEKSKDKSKETEAKTKKEKKTQMNDIGKDCSTSAGNLHMKSGICDVSPCKKQKKKKSKTCKVKEQICTPLTHRAKRESKEPQDKVVVIGAGVSGLTAANRLTELGISNVIVLEASNRVGGRILSRWFGDTVVDLGGEQSPLNNLTSFWDQPVIYQAEKAGMVKHPVTKQNIIMGLITELDGSPVPLPVSMMSVVKMKNILSVADSMKLTSGPAESGKNIEYIGVRMQQEIRGFPDEMKQYAARVMTALVILATDRPFMTNDESGVYITVPQSNVKIPLGNTSMITPLLGNLKEKIKFGKEVQTVKWGAVSSDGGKRAVIKTTDGDEFPADYIIFTPSLGVLKERFETFFCPALPGAKTKALDKASHICENKIFMRYDEPLWSWREEPINYEWKKEEVECHTGWLRGLRKIREVPGSEKVIVINLEGQGACQIEKENDTVITKTISEFLEKYLGKEVPKPVEILRSSWGSNHLYRGSRPSSGVGELAVTVPTSVEPSPPVIFFAGDATSVPLPGTIAGAYISGIREAEKIRDIVKRNH